MRFTNRDNLGASLTGKTMATYDSQYNHGRHRSSELTNAEHSMVPKASPARKAKPEAVSHSRPLDAISQRAMQVLATLPTSYQMHETRKTYPHVMNMIADSWHDPEFFFHVVRNLLIDQRGGRAGFQFWQKLPICASTILQMSGLRPERNSTGIFSDLLACQPWASEATIKAQLSITQSVQAICKQNHVQTQYHFYTRR